MTQNRQTHRAAQYSVAGELLKRGYTATILSGANKADLRARSPQTSTFFMVAVKGLYRKNPWLMKRLPPHDGLLFYVLVFLPPDSQTKFFIMTQREVTEAIEADLRRLGRPDDYPVTGVDWKLAQPHHDAWSKLPR